LGLHVRAAARPARTGGRPGAATAAPEQPAEQVAQPVTGPPGAARAATAPGLPEEVAQVEPESAALLPAETARHRPHRVVLLAALLVGQDVVGLGDLLETVLGVGVALVGVRVVLAGQLAVGLLDVVLGGVLRDTEDLV